MGAGAAGDAAAGSTPRSAGPQPPQPSQVSQPQVSQMTQQPQANAHRDQLHIQILSPSTRSAGSSSSTVGSPRSPRSAVPSSLRLPAPPTPPMAVPPHPLARSLSGSVAGSPSAPSADNDEIDDDDDDPPSPNAAPWQYAFAHQSPLARAFAPGSQDSPTTAAGGATATAASPSVAAASSVFTTVSALVFAVSSAPCSHGIPSLRRAFGFLSACIAASLISIRTRILHLCLSTPGATAISSFFAIIRHTIRLTIRTIRSFATVYPLAIIWSLNLIICEFFIPSFYIRACKWPYVSKKFEEHVVVVADPQLTDRYSYRQNPGILLFLTQFYSDFYMRRNYRLIRHILSPDYIIIAGDLMDGGREWSDDEFRQELRRLEYIFHVSPGPKMSIGVPGNHDIGVGDTVIKGARDRFLKTFGLINSVHQIADHKIITLDTVSIAGTTNSTPFREAYQFMQSFETPPLPQDSRTILVSHIPLYRPEGSYCGPRRHTPPITNRRGYQYQNLLQPEISAQILAKFNPNLIISGDDHDDCVYHHPHNGHISLEHTVPTFSWLQGNPYPAFGVLSLRPIDQLAPIPNLPTALMDICSLPPQLYIYFWYIVMLAITLVWVTISAWSQWRRLMRTGSNTLPLHKPPEHHPENMTPVSVNSSHVSSPTLLRPSLSASVLPIPVISPTLQRKKLGLSPAATSPSSPLLSPLLVDPIVRGDPLLPHSRTPLPKQHHRQRKHLNQQRSSSFPSVCLASFSSIRNGRHGYRHHRTVPSSIISSVYHYALLWVFKFFMIIAPNIVIYAFLLFAVYEPWFD